MHEMRLPKTILIGEDLSGVVAERLAAYTSRVLLLTSPTPHKLLGQRIESEASSHLEFQLFEVSKGSEPDIEMLASEARRGGSGAILGVGGGRVIDVAKAVAQLAALPFICVPTVASHDGIASPMTSIRTGGRAYSRIAVMPTEIIADMEVIRLAPRRYTLSGCGDLLAKYSAVRDWILGHKETGEYYGRYAAHLAYLSSIVVMRSAKLIGSQRIDGVRTVVEALISSGVSMGVAGSSRPCSGAEHLIAHALEYLRPDSSLHGERCGVATIFTSHLHGANWMRVKRSLEAMGAPSTASQLGVDEETLIEAIRNAPKIRSDRFTILHKRPMENGQIRDILHETGIV